MRKNKRKKTGKNISGAGDYGLGIKMALFTLCLIAVNLGAILFLSRPYAEKEAAEEDKKGAYIFEHDFSGLETGGKITRNVPVLGGEIEYEMAGSSVFADIYKDIRALKVCCPGNTSREYYTEEMPWAFILYDFEEGVPTITLFKTDKESGKGMFEIVILDSSRSEADIKAVEVVIFSELLKRYMKGYEWEGNVRVESF